MSIATCRGHVKVLDVLDGSPRRSELLKEIAALLKSHREDDARRWSGKCRKTEKSGKAWKSQSCQNNMLVLGMNHKIEIICIVISTEYIIYDPMATAPILRIYVYGHNWPYICIYSISYTFYIHFIYIFVMANFQILECGRICAVSSGTKLFRPEFPPCAGEAVWMLSRSPWVQHPKRAPWAVLGYN